MRTESYSVNVPSGAPHSFNPDEMGYYCDLTTNTLDLKGKEEGSLRFQGGVNGWGADHDIIVDYKVIVKARAHWQDDEPIDEIEIQICNFRGTFNGGKIGDTDREHISIEIYLQDKGINILDEVKKAYHGID